MSTIDDVIKIVGEFSNVTQAPHFDTTAFKIKKKIFVTFHEKLNRICVKLSLLNQNVFSSYDANMIHPVPNKWGTHGWTFGYLSEMPSSLLQDLLRCAYQEVSQPRK